jgi:hypothetical protein
MEETVMIEVPVFEIVTLSRLLTPTRTVANAIDEGATANVEFTPMPLAATVSGLPAAS